MLPRTPILTLTTVTLAACGADPAPPATRTTEVIGDTTIVRSHGPGEWGAPATLVPEISIGDMVQSQYRLVTEVLGLEGLYAVTGISMGGMQTFEWAVSHPASSRRRCL